MYTPSWFHVQLPTAKRTTQFSTLNGKFSVVASINYNQLLVYGVQFGGGEGKSTRTVRRKKSNNREWIMEVEWSGNHGEEKSWKLWCALFSQFRLSVLYSKHCNGLRQFTSYFLLRLQTDKIAHQTKCNGRWEWQVFGLSPDFRVVVGRFITVWWTGLEDWGPQPFVTFSGELWR